MKILETIKRVHHYFSLAKDWSKSSGCLKVQVGAVLVNEQNEIISHGWNDAYPIEPYCPREKLPSGTCYFLCSTHCRQVYHSETMAIYNARIMNPAIDLTDSIMYIYGHSLVCGDCKEAMIYHGIKEVIIKKDDKSKPVRHILRK